MMWAMANALTIAGSDSVGGAGLQADLKAFEAVGVHGCSVVTCTTSQNTKRVSSIFPIPPEEVSSQMTSVLEDVRLDAVKTGMLYSPEIVKVVAMHLKRVRAPVVVDPVMAASTGSSLHRSGFVETLIAKMLPIATLVTPNLGEAAKLSGVMVKDERSAIKAGDEIMELGPKAVLIKGGHLKGQQATDYLFIKRGLVKITSPRVTAEVHGTGCTLAAAITANLALGSSLNDSVRVAKEFVTNAIRTAPHLGSGNSPINI